MASTQNNRRITHYMRGGTILVADGVTQNPVFGIQMADGDRVAGSFDWEVCMRDATPENVVRTGRAEYTATRNGIAYVGNITSASSSFVADAAATLTITWVFTPPPIGIEVTYEVIIAHTLGGVVGATYPRLDIVIEQRIVSNVILH